MFIAAAVRLGGIYVAHLVDESDQEIKITDIDYEVFSDAARHVRGSGSPYARKTYRYTPLVAQICVMNTFIHPLACKFFFCALDLIQAWIYWDMVSNQLKSSRHEARSASIWKYVACLTFNPMIVGLAIRGSNDNMIALLVCVTVFLMLKRWYVLAGLFYGLSIHFKIYPIIFSFVFYFYIDCDRGLIASGGSPYKAIVSKGGFFTKDRLVFTFMTVATFLGFTAFFYHLYGYEFLYETYLYHFIRKDHRHNNSVYWYLIY